MPATYYNERGSAAMTEQDNPQTRAISFEYGVNRNPDNIVTLFTVNPLRQFSPTKNDWFAACPRGERYHKLGSISDPFFYVHDQVGQNEKVERRSIETSGQWKAMDFLNPQNTTTLDLNWVNEQEDSARGDNLVARGLFFIVRKWSPRGNEYDEPTEQELDAAETRLHTRYQSLVQLYQRVNVSSPSKLSEIMTAEMTEALNFAGIVSPYTQSLVAKTTCPNCGDQVPITAKFHRSSLGYDCVIGGADGWKAAVAAGFKKADEVPAEFQEAVGGRRKPATPAA